MAGQLSGMALYAALSEHIYRRDAVLDQTIKLVDITGTTAPLTLSSLPAGLNLQNDGGYIYSSGGGTSGFVAMVNLIGGKYVVTFRGTDSTYTAYGSVYAGALNGNTPVPTTPGLIQGILDYGDVYTSRNLGSGTTLTTQWDAAKALVDLVINNLAQGDKSKVVVTGQSMGGGLAGLASAYFGVEGNVFAPAPYAAQLKMEAMRKALPAFMAANQGYFNDAFMNLGVDQKIDALRSLPAHAFGQSYLLDSNPDNFAAVQFTLRTSMDTFSQPHNNAFVGAVSDLRHRLVRRLFAVAIDNQLDRGHQSLASPVMKPDGKLTSFQSRLLFSELLAKSFSKKRCRQRSTGSSKKCAAFCGMPKASVTAIAAWPAIRSASRQPVPPERPRPALAAM
jgi:hypothetical protein